MGNIEDREKNCFYCKTEVDGKYTIEFNFREDIICAICEKENSNEIKVYAPAKECCQFCGRRDICTRNKIIRLKRSVCPNCYDYFYNTQETRDMNNVIVSKNNMNKKFTRYGYICTYCDILYNKVTNRELRKIQYKFTLFAKSSSKYSDKETLVPKCYFCNHNGRYMRKCQVYSDKL